MSSHDVVAAVRRALGGPRTGHAGTLDPFATGLLLVLVGAATKAQRTMMELPKRYKTTARLGATSSTGDTEGEIVETGRMPADPPELPTGELRQRPPTHSAVKIGGERAYRRARRGESFEMPERIVSVESFDDPWYEGEGHVTTRCTEVAGTTTVAMVLRFGTRAIRDSVLKSPMADGMERSYKKLDELLMSTEKRGA